MVMRMHTGSEGWAYRAASDARREPSIVSDKDKVSLSRNVLRQANAVAFAAHPNPELIMYIAVYSLQCGVGLFAH